MQLKALAIMYVSNQYSTQKLCDKDNLENEEC